MPTISGSAGAIGGEDGADDEVEGTLMFLPDLKINFNILAPPFSIINENSQVPFQDYLAVQTS